MHWNVSGKGEWETRFVGRSTWIPPPLVSQILMVSVLLQYSLVVSTGMGYDIVARRGYEFRIEHGELTVDQENTGSATNPHVEYVSMQ